jgi:hypothetical protein
MRRSRKPLGAVLVPRGFESLPLRFGAPSTGDGESQDWPVEPAGERLPPVADYYLVRMARGPAWDHARRRREQDGWDAHAAFMDGLVDEGLIVLGGPVESEDGEHTVHVVDAESEAAIRSRLAEDPWADDMLTIESVEPWFVWLRKE